MRFPSPFAKFHICTCIGTRPQSCQCVHIAQSISAAFDDRLTKLGFDADSAWAQRWQSLEQPHKQTPSKTHFPDNGRDKLVTLLFVQSFWNRWTQPTRIIKSIIFEQIQRRLAKVQKIIGILVQLFEFVSKSDHTSTNSCVCVCDADLEKIQGLIKWRFSWGQSHVNKATHAQFHIGTLWEFGLFSQQFTLAGVGSNGFEQALRSLHNHWGLADSCWYVSIHGSLPRFTWSDCPPGNDHISPPVWHFCQLMIFRLSLSVGDVSSFSAVKN